jgi:hypothetical protein
MIQWEKKAKGSIEIPFFCKSADTDQMSMGN